MTQSKYLSSYIWNWINFKDLWHYNCFSGLEDLIRSPFMYRRKSYYTMDNYFFCGCSTMGHSSWIHILELFEKRILDWHFVNKINWFPILCRDQLTIVVYSHDWAILFSLWKPQNSSGFPATMKDLSLTRVSKSIVWQELCHLSHFLITFLSLPLKGQWIWPQNRSIKYIIISS